ncbi:oxysterol-binding protein-like protein [Conidiobolus coronatus NRRL 28638]|uniref:Oxysterol-binding protein-like protein n=1 Tax=Conidiobolus coronatus (strain ATCC 28846 / CBS 209.66 / NRRL 28638) TaxID=796925 RepID=A0A137PEW0_CONC2|nr:oxysterol-binding protein-like protein [Conidiobolus coronatus NRRL 28638]|eukprot:KXN73481.1 oxysterol-binding protein-like protein [Conidiobolus coronatus NRRL 28638]
MMAQKSPNPSENSEFIKTENLGFDENDNSDKGRLGFIMTLLKKLIGVSDIANLRISLPAQMLDPIPNLEHYTWLDRPDYFACLSQPEDPLERMIGVVRYCFSKELKFAKENIKKPYNSVLGEKFLCHWNVPLPNATDEKTVKVTMVSEQTSHHPPISAFWYECKETGVVACGMDQVKAKFSGTSFKVEPGSTAKGIYITLQNHGEEYHISHPSGQIQGILTGSPNLAYQESYVISCPQTKLRAFIEFKPERWIGKSRYLIEGKVFNFEPTYESSKTEPDMPPSSFKLSQVKDEHTLVNFWGSWRSKVFYNHGHTTKEEKLLIDIEEHDIVPKIVKPMEEMEEFESRKIWNEVTVNIKSREFSKATKAKQAIEDAQRKRTALRKEKGEIHEPEYFIISEEQPHKPILKDNLDLKF